MICIAPQTLEPWVARVFERAGVPGADAAVVARSLVGANLRGHDSHGVMRVIQYLQFLRDGVYQPGAPLQVEREAPGAVACDANWGFGQVQAHRLLDLIVPKARAAGVAAGTMRRCGHIGRLGEYAERAVAQRLVLIASVNNDGAGQRVAPPGGTQPRLGTNPLCIGVPTDGGPIVLDFGTSVVAEGKVRSYYLRGKEPVPEGWLLDSTGAPTCDSSVLYEPPLGSILPMGGAQSYKGFGLALLLDMLTGGLSGGHTSFAGAPPACGNCVLFVAIEPDHLGGVQHLARVSHEVAEFVRATPRVSGCDAITLPGDPESAALASRSEHGISIPDEHWRRLTDAARAVGVEAPPS